MGVFCFECVCLIFWWHIGGGLEVEVYVVFCCFWFWYFLEEQSRFGVVGVDECCAVVVMVGGDVLCVECGVL